MTRSDLLCQIVVSLTWHVVSGVVHCEFRYLRAYLHSPFNLVSGQHLCRWDQLKTSKILSNKNCLEVLGNFNQFHG